MDLRNLPPLKKPKNDIWYTNTLTVVHPEMFNVGTIGTKVAVDEEDEST